MTILLIEDNRLFSELIERSLGDSEVYIVGTLAAAQDWLQLFRADLILVDLGLPDSQGLSTLKALQSTRTPKVVLTGAEVDLAEVARCGGCDFIPKSGINMMTERIQFHISRLTKRARFAPDVFYQIRSYIEMPRRELIGAS